MRSSRLQRARTSWCATRCWLLGVPAAGALGRHHGRRSSIDRHLRAGRGLGVGRADALGPGGDAGCVARSGGGLHLGRCVVVVGAGAAPPGRRSVHCIAAFWLGRAGFDSRLDQPRDLWLLGGAALCGGAVLSAANAATWLMLAGACRCSTWPARWLAWWFGEATGLARRRRGAAGAAAHHDDRVPARRAGSATPRCCWRSRCRSAWSSTRWPMAGSALLPFAVLPLVALAWLALRGGSLLPTAGLAVLALAGDGAAGRWLAGAASRWPARWACARCGPAWRWRRRWCCWCMCSPAVPAMPPRRFELALESADLGVADWPLGAGVSYTLAALAQPARRPRRQPHVDAGGLACARARR